MKLSSTGKAIAFVAASFMVLAGICLNYGKSKLGASFIIVVSGCAIMLYAINGRKK